MKRRTDHQADQQKQSLFSIPQFRWLFAARSFAVGGSAFAPVAVAFAVMQVSKSAGALAVILLARQVSQVVFSLIAGVLADRLPRLRVLITADAIAFLSQGTVALLLFVGHAGIPALTLLSAVNGAAAAFVLPATNGVVPQIVPPDLVQQANATLRMSVTTLSIGGITASGVLVAAAGPAWAVAVDSATFLCSALLLTRLHLPGTIARSSATFLADLQSGWQEFWSRRWLCVTVGQACIFNAAYTGSLTVLGPIVANRFLGGAFAWAVIIAAHNVGYLVGGLFAFRLKPRRPLYCGLLMMVAEVPFIAALGAAGNFAAPDWVATGLIASAALVGGIGIEIFGVLWDTSLQTNIPGTAISRVSSYDQLGSFIFVPIGMAGLGQLISAGGTHAAGYTAAALMLCSVLVAVLFPAVRQLRRRPDPALAVSTVMDGRIIDDPDLRA